MEAHKSNVISLSIGLMPLFMFPDEVYPSADANMGDKEDTDFATLSPKEHEEAEVEGVLGGKRQAVIVLSFAELVYFSAGNIADYLVIVVCIPMNIISS